MIAAAAAPQSVPGRRAVLSFGVMTTGITACASPFPGRRAARGEGLFDYALSPDGRTIAAIQSDLWKSSGEQRRVWRLILYRWSSREITVVPLPERHAFSDIQFSPDVQRILAVRFRFEDAGGEAPGRSFDIVLINPQN